MAVDAMQIGPGHHLGGERRVLRRHAPGGKDGFELGAMRLIGRRHANLPALSPCRLFCTTTATAQTHQLKREKSGLRRSMKAVMASRASPEPSCAVKCVRSSSMRAGTLKDLLFISALISRSELG